MLKRLLEYVHSLRWQLVGFVLSFVIVLVPAMFKINERIEKVEVYMNEQYPDVHAYYANDISEVRDDYFVQVGSDSVYYIQLAIVDEDIDSHTEEQVTVETTDLLDMYKMSMETTGMFDMFDNVIDDPSQTVYIPM